MASSFASGALNAEFLLSTRNNLSPAERERQAADFLRRAEESVGTMTNILREEDEVRKHVYRDREIGNVALQAGVRIFSEQTLKIKKFKKKYNKKNVQHFFKKCSKYSRFHFELCIKIICRWRLMSPWLGLSAW